MEVTGKIKKIEPTQEIGSNGFKKRGVVITTDEQYPQHLLIEFVQDKTKVLDNFSEGQDVTISINLRGREWESPDGEVKYFNTINGWRCVAASTDSTAPVVSESDTDDLPF